MDNSEDTDIDSFLKNLCQPLPHSSTFLKEYGINFENNHGCDLSIQTTLNQQIYRDKSSLEDSVKKKLEVFQKKILGNASLEEFDEGEENFKNFGIEKEQVELLEKLSEAAAMDLPELQPCPSFQHMKHARSLTDQYNISLPEWTPFKAKEEDCSLIDGFQFLNNTLDQLIPELSDSVSIQEHSNKDKKIMGHTVQNIAKILANPYPSKTKSGETVQREMKVDAAHHVKCLKDGEKIPDHITDPLKEGCITETDHEPDKKKHNDEGSKKKKHTDEESKKKKKEKKGNKYVPKLVPINWCDPRSDSEFMKELADIMKCDAFNFCPSNTSQPPELDDMAERISLPNLPRDIIKMISATGEELEDWEYSIKVEKRETSDGEDDSEVEEMENELREIKNTEKFMQFKKQSEEATETSLVTGTIDVSEFLKVMIPPGVEDIVAKRDDEGNIISYEEVPRNEEEVVREFERLYLGLESDTEEEDEEDDPKDKMYEIDWEKEKIKAKSNKLLGGLQGTIPECELNEKVKEIEKYIETILSENAVEIDPTIEKHMEKVNKMLDDFGFPTQRKINEDTLEEYLGGELQKYDFLFKEREGKLCPPGNLITEVKPGDPDYHLITEQESLGFEKSTIKRPSNVVINLPHSSSESDEETPKIERLTSETKESRKTTKESEHSFMWGGDDYIDDIQYENDGTQNPEEDTDDEEHLTEEQEQELDNNFTKEYFKRGGTVAGLGETTIPEQNLKLETLESFSKKFLTFPRISEHSGSLNFVRMRRILAANYPEFSEESFSDLSKIENFPVPELENSSDSDSSDDIHIFYKPEPFTTADLMEKQPQNDSEDDHSEIPSADENENSDHDDPPPTVAESDTSIFEPSHLIPKMRRKRQSKSSESSASSGSNDNNEESKKNGSLVFNWAPFKAKPIPSDEGIVKNMKEINKIIVPKQKKFKVPKRMKKWLEGTYKPSKDDIRKWKNIYNNYFGDNPSGVYQFMNPNSSDMQEYELFMEGINEKFATKEETNPILLFKKLIEEQNKKDGYEINVSISVEENNKKDGYEINVSASVADEHDRECVVSETLEPKSFEISSHEEKNIEVRNDEVDNCEVADLVEKNFKIDNCVKLQFDQEENCLKKAQLETEAPHPPKIPVLRLRDVPRPLRKEEWAEEVNSNAKIELVGTPAMSYPFELDGFQKHAIQALEDGYNVFVSAHTSAGKTVVAEYAIAMSKRNRSKAVYTSPVKALSNQKYADFKRIFGSVGLITGDIQLNENAECLIMTTEILRSMLYNTSEKIRDLEFVVFDEVHYINDPERGHVWEEVLILLPPQVQIVMLSATVPNTLEFANWVGRTKQRKVLVCATHHRPVPLQHYIYTGTGGPSPGDTYLVKDGDGPFLITNYGKAEAAMKINQEKERKNRKKQMLKRAEEEKEWKRGAVSKPKPMLNPSDSQDKRDQTLWISVVSFLQKKDWLPAVVFVFSRKKCDVFAEKLRTIDLTTKSEKSFIHRFIKSQVEKLDEVDQDLPQIKVMQNQLLQGIGVHHSGILPVMKEIVEVLFQEGKVKMLFATETFAMGVNMPARTVLFHSIKKFDGTETRLLHPAEYIQMAGRAGRRGKDSAGNVIILAKPAELIARHDLETLMFGNPSKLISKFRLSYRMILNTLTMSGMLTVQSMMASSYCENQGQLKKKFVEKDLIEAEQFEKNLQKRVDKDVTDIDVEYMTKFYTYAHAYLQKWKQLRLQMICHGRILKDLHPGRLLKVCTSKYINRTALLLEAELHKDPLVHHVYRVMILEQDTQYTRDITAIGMEMDQEQLDEWYRLVSLLDNLPSEKDVLSGPNEYSVLVIKPVEILAVCKETLKLQKNQIQDFLAQHNNRPGFRNKISEAGDKLASQLWAYVGKTSEINERCQGFENYNLCLNVTEMWSLADQVKKNPIRYNPLVINSFKKVFRWKQAEEKVKTLRMSLSDENMILYPDFKNKKALLKEKEYIDDSDTVQIKGYMAARVGKYELVVCELLVENILVNMEPEEVAALLSFLVCKSNNSDHYPTSFKTLTSSLQEGIRQCQKIIQEVILLEKQFQIEDYEGSETSKLSFGLVPIMYAWVKQEPFKNIMEMEELQEFEFQEGLLVRWIQQLLETLKEVEAAARVMGDPAVPTKLQAAGQLIKRGIVFAPSLYTTMLK